MKMEENFDALVNMVEQLNLTVTELKMVDHNTNNPTLTLRLRGRINL